MTTGSSSRPCDRRPSSRRKTSAINVSCRLHYQRGTENASSAILWLHDGSKMAIIIGERSTIAYHDGCVCVCVCLCGFSFTISGGQERRYLPHKRRRALSDRWKAVGWHCWHCQWWTFLLRWFFTCFPRNNTFLWTFLWKGIYPLRAMRKPVVGNEFWFPFISAGRNNYMRKMYEINLYQ